MAKRRPTPDTGCRPFAPHHNNGIQAMAAPITNQKTSIQESGNGRPGWWPLPLLLAAFLAITFWSVYRAAVGVSAITDPQYYSHGLRYEDTLLEQRAAAAQGWSLAARLDGDELTVILADAEDTPLRGATCELLLQPEGRPLRYRLGERAPGRYTAQLPPATTAATLQATLDCRLAGAAVHRTLLIGRSWPQVTDHWVTTPPRGEGSAGPVTKYRHRMAPLSRPGPRPPPEPDDL